MNTTSEELVFMLRGPGVRVRRPSWWVFPVDGVHLLQIELDVHTQAHFVLSPTLSLLPTRSPTQARTRTRRRFRELVARALLSRDLNEKLSKADERRKAELEKKVFKAKDSASPRRNFSAESRAQREALRERLMNRLQAAAQRKIERREARRERAAAENRRVREVSAERCKGWL